MPAESSAALRRPTPPILFLLFNRPDFAQRVFDRIQMARPTKLFVAVDGPRPGCEAEAKLCAQCQNIVDKVDWDCQVQTLYRSENLGCQQAVSEALSWFFDQVEEGIILEDDCVPEPSFFPYCAALLERFRNDQRIMCITGTNVQDGSLRGDGSYYFSTYMHCWGWATWSRAWLKYEAEMARDASRRRCFPQFMMGHHEIATYWETTLSKAAAGEFDSWAYRWLFSCWQQSGLTVVPQRNLISNIGFDDRGTHVTDPNSKLAEREVGEIGFPLTHPHNVCADYDADLYQSRTFYNIKKNIPGTNWRLQRKAKSILKQCVEWLRDKRDGVRKEPSSS